MVRRIMLLLVMPLLSGCWQSEANLYADLTPVTPFKPGAIAIRNTDDPEVSHQQLTLDGTAYRISGRKDEAIMVLRFYSLPGTLGYLVADATGLASCPTGACEKGPHSYGLVHSLPDGRVEELAQNCDGDRAERVGATKKGFVCEFSDRATLEKALRTLVTEKPTAIITPE
jgi:hypothetical protein